MTIDDRVKEILLGDALQNGDKTNLILAARKASFNPKKMPLREWIDEDSRFESLRGTTYAPTWATISDSTLLPSSFMHCQKRILDHQWRVGSRTVDYLDDLMEALTVDPSQISVKVGYRGSHTAAAYLRPIAVPGQILKHAEPLTNQALLIIFDPRMGHILTGFLFDAWTLASYPRGWLKTVEVTR